MIERKFDPTKAYRAALYGRMSENIQNPRSPDQQFHTIEELIKRLKYPWIVVKKYRDDGIKGRYRRKRKSFQAMLRDIALGIICVDLIVVDTWERFGRAEEFQALRRKLWTQHGVLIVTADSNFADPTGPTGKALAMVEGMRSTEETRIRAHNVLRGKRDAALLKYWPGAPIPLGFRLEYLVDNSRKEPVFHGLLKHDQESSWVMQRAFRLAAATGWGGPKLCREMNKDPEIPEKFKPFKSSTMRRRLTDPIYVGTLVWFERCTDIIDDNLIVEQNPDPERVLRIENFCEPLIVPETFDAVQLSFAARSKKHSGKNAGADDGKLIKPLAPGKTLKNPLAGLVRCSECGITCHPQLSGAQSKKGERYSYYRCRHKADGGCSNSTTVRAGPLWEAVVGCLRKRLFPSPENPTAVPDWFPLLVAQVEKELAALKEEQPQEEAALSRQVADLDRQIAGWKLSLGDPDLPASVRLELTASYATSLETKASRKASHAERTALAAHVKGVLAPDLVLQKLHRLDELLSGANATLLNIELGQHIQQIKIFPDGRGVFFGTNLGLLEGAVELLSRGGNPEAAEDVLVIPANPVKKIRPRQLGRRATSDLVTDTSIVDELQIVMDPERFRGLPEGFIWQETFIIGKKLSWSEIHAEDVARYRAEHPGLTLNAIEVHFGKSRPTIYRALRIAKARTSQAP